MGGASQPAAARQAVRSEPAPVSFSFMAPPFFYDCEGLYGRLLATLIHMGLVEAE